MKNLFLGTLLSLLTISISLAQSEIEGYKLVNLGNKVNSRYHEGAPIIAPDGKTLYFFVDSHPSNNNGKGSQEIWYSEFRSDGQWGEARHLGSPFNQHHSNQVFSILNEGRTLFIRGGSKKNSKGFSLIHKSGNSWGNLEELSVEDFDNMNRGRFYGASMNSTMDVMILFFSETPNSAYSNLYVSKKVQGNQWSRPEKLPENINTDRDEFGPFITHDDKIIYYSSSRKDMGFGGPDIYRIERKDNTWKNWTDPVNLGETVNTRAFDAYFSIDRIGNAFTTRSSRTIDGGNLDIFGLKPLKPKINLAGLVLDENTKFPIKANLTIGTKTQVPKAFENNDDYGAYNVEIPGPGDFILSAEAPGYKSKMRDVTIPQVKKDSTVFADILLEPLQIFLPLTVHIFDSKTNNPVKARLMVSATNGSINGEKMAEAGRAEWSLEGDDHFFFKVNAEGYLGKEDSLKVENFESQESFNLDIYLDPIEIGTTVRLNNIFFDFDKAVLKEESFPELEKVVDFLNNNPTVEIEIAGHTDGRGSAAYNLNLSEGRAAAVRDYIISRGIPDYKITSQGYGLERPIATNDTDEGRAENRRVEFVVLKK